MRKLVLVALLGVAAAVPARAQDVLMGDPHLVSQFPIDAPQVFAPAALVPAYDNLTNFTGSAYANGGAALLSGIMTTKYVADDINIAPAYVGKPIVQFYFSVANLNPVAVPARARVRFHQPNGAGGGPGTYITGFTFNPINFAPGVSTFFTNIAATNLPAQFWAGMTFDNSGTGATQAQLNGLGQGIFGPPAVGSSADVAFTTTSANIGNVQNPPGSTFNFGGQPPANFGWAFIFDEPVPAEVSSWGRIKAQYHN